jgi:hypothetical protein
MEKQETRLDANWQKLNLLEEQQQSVLSISGQARGIADDEILQDPSEQDI